MEYRRSKSGRLIVPEHEGVRGYRPGDVSRYARYRKRWSLSTIAFDAATNGGEDLTPGPFNHVVGAGVTEGILLVGIAIRDADTTIGATAVSSDLSGALTKLRADIASIRARSEIWYKAIGSTVGTHSISATLSAAPEDAGIGAISFSGVDQTTPMDVAGGAGANAATGHATANITTVTDLAWTFAMLALQSDVSTTIGASQTQRWTQAFSIANGRMSAGTSSAAVSPAGSKTMNWTLGGGSDNWALSIAAIRPAGGGSSKVKDMIGGGIVAFPRA